MNMLCFPEGGRGRLFQETREQRLVDSGKRGQGSRICWLRRPRRPRRRNGTHHPCQAGYSNFWVLQLLRVALSPFLSLLTMQIP